METQTQPGIETTTFPPLAPNWYRDTVFGAFVKRTMDIVLAGFGLILISPILIAVAIWIVIDNPGPVFYRGLRAGKGNSRFRIFKFRSMVVNAEKLGGGSTAQNDPRITKAGHFVRRYKIDELPQLLNILSGEMSMVGPRPELPRYTDMYTGEAEFIHLVKPGLTDISSIEFIQLGDVLGAVDADAVYEEKVMPIKNGLRIRYVREMSLGTDIRLVLKTLLKLARRQ